MLVLSREKGEAIIIGHGTDRIKIAVVDVRGDKVRIGIDAPQEYSVHREEVQQAIDRGEERVTEGVRPAWRASRGGASGPH